MSNDTPTPEQITELLRIDALDAYEIRADDVERWNTLLVLAPALARRVLALETLQKCATEAERQLADVQKVRCLQSIPSTVGCVCCEHRRALADTPLQEKE